MSEMEAIFISDIHPSGWTQGCKDGKLWEEMQNDKNHDGRKENF